MAFDPFVKATQEKLLAAGYDVGRGGADGVAGDDTTAALRKFQGDNSLPVTGTITPETWNALDSSPMPERDQDVDPNEPGLPNVPTTWPRQKDVEAFYGRIVNNAAPNQTRLQLPYPMKIAWDLGKTVSSISIHEKVHDSAARVFGRIADAYSPAARADLGIDLFGGSTNVRKMRGGSKWSMHSWGIAIDFDPIRNQLKWKRDRARLGKPDAAKFFDLWEEEGWISLGRARDFDWMHVQAARL